MTVQSLGVAFYSRGGKHSENNSDNRSETQQQEKSGRNFLVTIVSVSENSNIWHVIWSAETCKKNTRELKHEILIKKFTFPKFEQFFSDFNKEKTVNGQG